MKLKLYFAILFMFICFVGKAKELNSTDILPPTASISYLSPICNQNSIAFVSLTGTGAYTGGTFTSPGGLVLDTNTGSIDPTLSIPGDYTVTYYIAPSGGDPAFSCSTTVTILASVVPIFNPIAPICQGTIPPILPSTSINIPLISGTWSPTIIDTSYVGITTYIFTPNPGQCAITFAMDIEVTAPNIIPTFTQFTPICQGENAPMLPLISTNSTPITGTWNPSNLDTNTVGTYLYTFTPNSGQCALTLAMSMEIVPKPNPIIISSNGLNEIYEDDATGTLIQGLNLDSQLSGNFSYQWFEDGILIVNETNSNFAISNAWLNGITHNFTIIATNNDTSCQGTSISFAVTSSPVPPPMANPTQVFVQGQTLANLVVAGTDIKWYSSSLGRNSNTTTSTPLPLTTLLVANTTYFASQTINGFESVLRSPVTVQANLANDKFSLQDFSISPNPIKDYINIKSIQNITNITIYNNLSQIVYCQKYNNLDLNIDLSDLVSGNYFIKVVNNNYQQVFQVLKI